MLNLSIYLVGSVNTMVFGSNKFRIRRSQSKASYLAYRRERGAPDSEGSYKRTMSPTSRLEDWSPPRDHDDPVLLRVTPHHPLHHSHHHPHHNPHLGEIAKSHSVDALHHRLEERNQHPVDLINKQDLGKKDPRLRTTGENNNNDNLQDRHQHSQEKRFQEKKEVEQRRERLSPQSVEALNDRNRQLERERRKLAASCEPLGREKPHRLVDNAPPTPSDDFFRERSATIELTSQNIELLNRRNEKRIADASNLCNTTSCSTSTITTITTTLTSTDGSCWSRAPCSSHDSTINHICPIKPSLITERCSNTPNSPPKSPTESNNSVNNSPKESSTPRRTPSSGSSNSNSSKSSDNCTSPQILDARISPKTLLETSAKQDTSFALDNSSGFNVSHRKVSSPTQTDNTGICNRPGSPILKDARAEKIDKIERNERTVSFSKSKSSGKSMKLEAGCCSSRNLEQEMEEEVEKEEDVEDDKITSPCVSPQPGIEGLTLVQRTEVVLRVNAATSDAASQTENNLESNVERDEGVVSGGGRVQELTGTRKKLPEEIECEELSRDLASQLSPNDKLVTILVPAPEHKKPTDYVSGLFRVEATLQPRPRRRLSLEESTSSVENGDDDKKHETIPSAPVTPLSSDPTSPLSPTSAYFTTSEGKARFLTRFEGLARREDAPAVVTTDSLDLRQKKEELMMRLDKKLVVLRAEQEAVREEGEVNEALGARVATLVAAVARPAEASKYRLHVEEVGKITSLLLGLSGRLARAENALYGMPADHSERKILESKRDKLMDQLEEAKILKGNIDKRSINVSAILSKYLNEEEFADYQHFINMKAKLIMDGREIQDKVKLGEEQLAALREAID